MAEMTLPGLDTSKSFVQQPECYVCIERFHRTLEEEVLSLNYIKSLEEANEAIEKFIENYNKEWLIFRLGYKPSIEYRMEYEKNAAWWITA